MTFTMRHTVKNPITVHGTGLHSGRSVSLSILPAPLGFGLVFRRLDMLPGRGDVAALHTNALPATLCTRLVNPYGASVSTIEHLMAALHATGVTDALLTISTEEVPILDGSAQGWMTALRKAGTVNLGVPATVYKVAREVRVERGAAWACLRPYAGTGLTVSCTIDFADPAIGQQSYTGKLTTQRFREDLAPARTFCMAADIRTMHAQGLALGGNLERAVIFHQGKAMNPEGLRFANEPARHKALDVVGDLFLAGGFLNAAFVANRPGHALTGALLAQAFATPGCLVPAASHLHAMAG